jgi:gamma-glutamyl:cysteine ligase YbdK (ATP-grasp superfamily)
VTPHTSSDAAELRIISGDPTPSELAAITAVLSAMIEEAESSRRQSARRGQSAWQRSQQPIRQTLAPGFGAWRTFGG